ncbi:hypothetical protein CRYUN_Cryun19dG0087000 [Craigia yunnanensis]
MPVLIIRHRQDRCSDTNDVNDDKDDKDCHLAIHIDKLAIVFAILNTKPETPIRITKNLRIYRDCHIVAKLISQIAEREIIVMDTYRFHHFQWCLLLWRLMVINLEKCF